MAATACDTSRTAARQITMDLVLARSITGDVARLAGCCEKATGAHDGKK